MLASHTSIRHLFSKCLSQYEKLRKKQAFLDNYRKFPMFAVSCHHYKFNGFIANLICQVMDTARIKIFLCFLLPLFANCNVGQS